jgi:Aminotransferase class I and II
MNYDEFFADAIGRLWHERRYRVFADLERIAGQFPRAIWHSPQGSREVVIWCSKRLSRHGPTSESDWRNGRDRDKDGPCRCGPLLCSRLHLYHCAAASNLRGGNGRYSPPEELAQSERTRQQECAARVKSALTAAGLPIMLSETHIVPVMVGDPEKCKRASDLLLSEHGIYLQPINYPTVPRGTERLRITATPYHDDVLIDQLAQVLTDVWRRVALPLEGCVIDAAE